MARVIVLEDEEVRVEWLRQVLRPSGAEVVSTKIVSLFIEMSKLPHNLAIFDHDIAYQNGPDGKSRSVRPNGADAARLYDPPTVVQTLVWSFNEDGAKNIESILKGRKIPVVRHAYDTTRLEALAVGLKDMFGW